ncbi:MAG: hypothetical protein ACW99A_09370 [Candidatus Kariarchaeaceae archaeon]|jgi:DNA-binding MarR family transcriptional regulator
MTPDDFNLNTGFDAYSNQLINTIDQNQFDSNLISSLYREEQLTQDEYIILDFIGVNDFLRDGTITISFQAMKRITDLHQARLTKAINRLISKDLLKKEKFGYTLTEEGYNLFKRLHQQYNKYILKQSRDLHIHVAEGKIQGPPIYDFHTTTIEKALVGKWFGKYRYTSKIQNKKSLEIGWISTDTTINASLKVGPQNQLKVTISCSEMSLVNEEMQLLLNHLSEVLESAIDAPVIFNQFSIFDNNNQRIEIDSAKINFAG